MLTTNCQKSVVEGKTLGLHSTFFGRAQMKTHALTIKIAAKKLKNVRNCERPASSVESGAGEMGDRVTDSEARARAHRSAKLLYHGCLVLFLIGLLITP